MNCNLFQSIICQWNCRQSGNLEKQVIFKENFSILQDLGVFISLAGKKARKISVTL